MLRQFQISTKEQAPIRIGGGSGPAGFAVRHCRELDLELVCWAVGCEFKWVVLGAPVDPCLFRNRVVLVLRLCTAELGDACGTGETDYA